MKQNNFTMWNSLLSHERWNRFQDVWYILVFVRSKPSTFCSHVLMLMVHKNLKTHLGNRTQLHQVREKGLNLDFHFYHFIWKQEQWREHNLYEVPSKTMNLTFNIIHSKVYLTFCPWNRQKPLQKYPDQGYILNRELALHYFLSLLQTYAHLSFTFMTSLASHGNSKKVVEMCSHWYE